MISNWGLNMDSAYPPRWVGNVYVVHKKLQNSFFTLVLLMFLILLAQWGDCQCFALLCLVPTSGFTNFHYIWILQLQHQWSQSQAFSCLGKRAAMNRNQTEMNAAPSRWKQEELHLPHALDSPGVCLGFASECFPSVWPCTQTWLCYW